ncbi:MAG: hypothetical protein WCF85_00040 [Rhodospirillaceae bacterium]
MWFMKRKSDESISTDAVYRRVVNGRVVDTAKILGLSRNSAGIPHVRFNVHHERSEAPDELRTLAVGAFRETFSEQASV